MPRREVDLMALVAGLVFVGLGVLFVGDGLAAWSLDVRWVAAILLIGLGVANLAATLRPRHRGERSADQAPGGPII